MQKHRLRLESKKVGINGENKSIETKQSRDTKEAETETLTRVSLISLFHDLTLKFGYFYFIKAFGQIKEKCLHD